MNFDDYEQLPSTSVVTNMTAGAIAGVLEHCVMYPLDSVKTRMQSLSPVHSGLTVYQTLSHMVSKEGILRPIRGMGAVVLGAGPAHAFYFGTYEYTKEKMSLVSKSNHLHYIVAATTATLIHDAISNPTEVIKQRLQMYDSPYRSVVHCTKMVYRNEGFRAFYRSYCTQLFMNLPYQAIHFSAYEFFQNLLNKDRKYNPPVHMIAGGAAGAAAAAFTTPLDVTKTLLNTQETGIGSTRGMLEAISQIYKMAGPLGFFKGLVPRVLYSMPATAICWSTYEFFKYILSRTPKSISNDQRSKDVVAKLQLADDTSLPLRYALPNTILSAESSSSSSISTASSAIHQPPSIHRETSSTSLPVISGAGMYNALSLNTMHSDNNPNTYDRSCKTILK